MKRRSITRHENNEPHFIGRGSGGSAEDLETLSAIIQEFGQYTVSGFGGTEHLLVVDRELLRTQIFHP